MKKIDKKAIPVIVFVIILFFVVPYFWRKNRDNNIEQNSRYAMAKITKQLSSLKNGRQWYYEFIYQNKIYEWYRSTHVGYDVKVGDYFLVQFSFKNPQQSKIFYEYQLRSDKIEYKSYSWDTIPISILQYHKKKDRFW